MNPGLRFGPLAVEVPDTCPSPRIRPQWTHPVICSIIGANSVIVLMIRAAALSGHGSYTLTSCSLPEMSVRVDANSQLQYGIGALHGRKM